MMPQKNNRFSQKPQVVVDKACYFCQENLDEVDYKDAGLLRRFTSSYGKIAPRRRSGLCAKHQRKVAMGIKRARVMALLPFVNR